MWQSAKTAAVIPSDSTDANAPIAGGSQTIDAGHVLFFNFFPFFVTVLRYFCVDH
jgi:hypothetical protein